METLPIQSTTKLPIRSLAEIEKAGEILSKGRVFGINNAAEGFAMVSCCLQERISFLQFNSQYHIIDGKPSIKAEQFLVRLRKFGGEYSIVSRTPDEVTIDFECGKAKYRESVKWEELKQEKYVYQRDGRTLKDNYSTPRRRMQMMWARAISDGVRVVCPEATSGMYTPEEVSDYSDAAQSPIIVNDDIAPEAPVKAVFVCEEEAQAPMPAMPIELPDIPPVQISAMPFDLPISEPEQPAQSKTNPFMQGYETQKCPIQGEHYGKLWAELPTDFLALIKKTIKTPGITDKHRAEIDKELTRRNENAK